MTVPDTTARWARIGLWLVGVTLAYNVAEGCLALFWGWKARSIALVGFGLDSWIEVAAAGVVLWRLRLELAGAAPEELEAGERRVERFVGITFFLWRRMWSGGPAGSCGAALHQTRASSAWRSPSPRSSSCLGCLGQTARGVEYRERCAAGGGEGDARLQLPLADAPPRARGQRRLGLVVGRLLMVPWLVREGVEAVRGETCDADAGRA